MRPIDYFDTAAEVRESAVAIIDGEKRISFGELKLNSERLAAALPPFSASDPARMAVIGPNTHHVMTCTLGAMRAGAVLVPVHAQDGCQKKAAFLAEVRPQRVFYHSTIAHEVDFLRRACPAAAWVCLDAASGGDPSLDELLDTAPKREVDWGDVYGSPEHPVYLRQTSGTTGVPKIVVNDVGSFAAIHAVLRQKLDGGLRHPVSLVAAPLSHAAGVHAFSMLTLGATLVLMANFDATQILLNIPRYGVTHIWLPPTGLYLLLSCPEVRTTDLSSVKSLVLGAAAVAPEKLREAVEIWGPVVSINYAQIEGGFLTWLDADVVAAAASGEHPERLRSSGDSLFVSRVAIMDEDGHRLGAGETGEIVVRGRSVKPYLDNAETAAARVHGWHHTGDVGYLDQDGFLFVVGRKKDNIITGGLKVSAAEVEQVLMELPSIHECAVVGTPDDMRGEIVKAVITVRPGAGISSAEVLKHCRARLGPLKSPRSVEQWPMLPKSAVGKIDKHAVRAQIERSTRDRRHGTVQSGVGDGNDGREGSQLVDGD